MAIALKKDFAVYFTSLPFGNNYRLKQIEFYEDRYQTYSCGRGT